MEYKLKFENGRSCEIYCESDGKPLQDKINAAEERFGSQVKTINGKEVKEHGLGGFLVGAIIGGIAGNAVAKQGLKKTVKQVARKTTSTVKKAVDSVKKKEAPKSKRSNYIPNRLIDSIETKSGKKIENKDIIDGAHTKSKVLVSKKRVDSQPKDIDKSKKLSLQTDYLSARKIKVVNTTYGRKLKGSEIIDGAYVKKGVFADGGSIDKFNWKSFTLVQLMAILPDDVKLAFLSTPEKIDINFSDIKEIKPFLKTKWTISDYANIGLKKGTENIYLDIVVYDLSSKSDLENKITIYTKENHEGLKQLASKIVQKFKDGGLPESRPNFSSMSKEELIDYSKKNNIHYATGWSKETLIDTIEDALDSRYAKGGGVDSKRYKVIIYHGGEQRDQVKYASTLEEARELSFQGEHSEIVDTKTNKLVYEDGGRIDLFDTPDEIPSEVQAIMSEYELEDNDYQILEELQGRLETETGYTFDFGLDGTPFGLRPVGVSIEEIQNSEMFANGGSTEDYTKNLARVKVKFKNPKYDYITSVNGEITESDARKYFVGNVFDRGTYPRENMQRVIDIEFYPKGTYAFGGGVEMNSAYKANSKYLNSISSIEKNKILQNIANHYGITIEEANEEVTTPEAEYLYEYIANNASLRYEIYTDMKSGKFAKGGMTEHGLRLGDEIFEDGAKHNYPDEIVVKDENNKKHFVNLNKGTRGQAFAKGGVIGQEITFNHWSGDVKRGTIDDVHSTGEYIVQSGFGSMLVNPDDVISISSPEKEKRFLGIFENGGSVDSSLLTDEENKMLKLILEHPIFDGYKEIQTFTSGGSNYHTMILLSNNHIVTVNYESKDIQYSYDTYDSIDQYLDPEAFIGDVKGWDNEYYTPKSDSRTTNYSNFLDLSFFEQFEK